MINYFLTTRSLVLTLHTNDQILVIAQIVQTKTQSEIYAINHKIQLCYPIGMIPRLAAAGGSAAVVCGWVNDTRFTVALNKEEYDLKLKKEILN